MKFYSEKLDQLFETEQALHEAESKVKKKSTKSAKTTAEVSPPSRKELAEKVELADIKVREAYANYDACKLQAEELSKKFLEELSKILEPAKKQVSDAERLRYDAIREFNESYGTYQVTYTGAKAAEELTKAIDSINCRADKLFRSLIW